MTAETAGAEQRRVEDVEAIRCCDADDTVARGEAVHLDEDLVERLFALAVYLAGGAGAADGVDLVDEDDRAGLVAAGALEQLAHAAGADADELLDEVAAARCEEGDAGLAGQRLGEQRLAGTGSPWRMTPEGGFAPISSKRSGWRRNSTTSASSSTASSTPAMSPKRSRGTSVICAEARSDVFGAPTMPLLPLPARAAPCQCEHDQDHGDEEERGEQQAEQRDCSILPPSPAPVTRTSTPCAASSSSSRPSSSGRTIVGGCRPRNIATALLAPASYRRCARHRPQRLERVACRSCPASEAGAFCAPLGRRAPGALERPDDDVDDRDHQQYPEDRGDDVEFPAAGLHPSSRSRRTAALISARWVNACGKLPSSSPLGPISSE